MSTPRNLRSQPRPFSVRQIFKGTAGGILTNRTRQERAESEARRHVATFGEACGVFKGDALLLSIAADGTETRAVRLQTVQELDALLSGVGCYCGHEGADLAKAKCERVCCRIPETKQI